MATVTQKKMVPGKANMPEWSLEMGACEFRDIQGFYPQLHGKPRRGSELKGIGT